MGVGVRKGDNNKLFAFKIHISKQFTILYDISMPFLLLRTYLWV